MTRGSCMGAAGLALLASLALSSLALASLALAPAQAKAAAKLRPEPRSAEWTYRYEAREYSGDKVSGYNLDYRLKSDRSGGLTAVVLKAETVEGQTTSPAAVDAACAKALGGRPGELARITLYPMTPDRAKLGDAFLPPCAPRAVFFPLTDILNVTLVQASNGFHLDRLQAPGDMAAFDGFDASFERLGMRMSETSDGGRIAFADLKGGRAFVDWAPTPSRLQIINGEGASAVTLKGTEHFAFRLEIDARSGVLERASTLYDDLDLTVQVPGLPADKLPVVKLRRTVTLTRIRR